MGSSAGANFRAAELISTGQWRQSRAPGHGAEEVFMNDQTTRGLRSQNQPVAVAARPPLPPFTRETATLKVRLAEDGWNSRDPETVVLATRQIPAGETARNLSTDGRKLYLS